VLTDNRTKPKESLIKWVKRGEEFFSSEGGRFDCWRLKDGSYIAIDWDYGKKFIATSSACKIWCNERNGFTEADG
jgi:hypothetical protein